MSVQDGAKVTITQDADPKARSLPVRSRGTQALSIRSSRTLNVQVDVDNGNGQLLPGAYVFVHLQAACSFAHCHYSVEYSALSRRRASESAWCAMELCSLTPITIGHDFGATVEVTSGLTTERYDCSRSVRFTYERNEG